MEFLPCAKSFPPKYIAGMHDKLSCSLEIFYCIFGYIIQFSIRLYAFCLYLSNAFALNGVFVYIRSSSNISVQISMHSFFSLEEFYHLVIQPL